MGAVKQHEPVLFSMPSFQEMKKERKEASGLSEVMKSPEAVEREAYERGFEAGEKAGMEMGQEKAAIMLTRLEEIISEIEGFKKDLKAELESQVLELATVIARKIIVSELALNPEVLGGMVKEAIGKLDRTGTITIKINPALHDLFKRMKPMLLESHEDIVFDADPSVSHTGPVVTGYSQEVATDIDMQLMNIAEAMAVRRGLD